MNVDIHLFGPLREDAGRKEISLSLDEGATVRDAIDALVAEYPELEDDLGEGAVESYSVTVNEADVKQREGLDTDLDDGDVVRIAPPVVGGAPA